MTQISIQNLIFTRIYFLLTLFIIIIGNLSASIINIPADQPTIQAGIDVAVEGDTVLVAPGTYYENISITQKDSIHIVGSGADVTTIDGGENGHVVWFDHSSGSIYNFTVTNSGDNPGYSAGIFTSHSSVIIISNIIYNNCYGLAISSSSEAQIHENRIIDNTGFRTVAISASTADISYNLIAENSNSGIYNDIGSPITVLNNTIVGSNDHIGLTLNAEIPLIVHNNIISNFRYGIFVLGDQQSSVPFVDIAYNDLWNNTIANYWEEYNLYSQPFLPQPGTGELYVDPLFVDPLNGDYQLQPNSLCIDAGDPNSSYDPDGTIADIGAYYYHQYNGIDQNIINYSSANLNSYPNPFNPTTTIEFLLPYVSIVNLSIFNLKGQKIKTLADNKHAQGSHSIVWNGDDEFNKPVSSGIYFYKLNVDGKTEAVKKCLLLK